MATNLDSTQNDSHDSAEKTAPEPNLSTGNAYEATLTSVSGSEFPYRALSRGAIASVLVAPFALLGFVPAFKVMLVMSVIGLAAAILGLRVTQMHPKEYSGRMLAKFGMGLNLLLLAAGIGMHAYIYATEVPDGYERVHFYALQQPTKSSVDMPTEEAVELNGKNIFLKGYIHPASGNGRLTRFVLVPDLGTCCFGGQPRSTDMVEVTLTKGNTIRHSMMQVKLAGEFLVSNGVQKGGFDKPVFYRLRANYAK